MPPELRPPPRNPPIFAPYSSTNARQYMRPVPVYTMPQYLVSFPILRKMKV